MARRRSKKLKEKDILGFFMVIASLWLTTAILKGIQHDPGRFGTLIALILAGAGLFFFIKESTRVRRRKALLQQVVCLAHNNGQALARRKLQLLARDPYGRVIREKWIKELSYFITHHIKSHCSSQEAHLLESMRDELMEIIDNLVDEENRKSQALLVFSDDMTPAQFEIFCAETLKRCGWDAHATARSRDQGVDVIAEKSGHRLVLQCKLYASPVGNKAVQEIAAGCRHEKANYAAVVSNNRYTASAEQLAMTNGVLLLHFRDLDSIDTRLGLKAEPTARNA